MCWKGHGKLFPRPAYEPFRSSRLQDGAFLLAGTVAALLLGYLFFKSVKAFILAIPFGCGALRFGRHKVLLKRQERLETELRDYLLSVIALLRAGYALENAMIGAEKEIYTMHGPKGLMGREARIMSRELYLKTPPEKLWQSFAERTGSKNGKQLAQIFQIAKRQGGDYLPVLKSAVRLMDAQGEVRREIGSLLAGQKLEFYIMCLVPTGMLLYLDVSSPDMTRFLYENAGRLFMAGVLALYALAVYWGDRILEKSYGE